MTSGLEALLRGIVDYAGMFPPAARTSSESLAMYFQHRADRHAWMLGSLVMSSAVLAQLDAAAEGLDRVPALSIVLTGDLALQLDVALTHAAAGRRYGRRTTLEFPPQPAPAIASLAGRVPGDVSLFFETPADAELDERLDAIAQCHAGAKIRTGGIRPDAFPSEREITRFFRGCVDRGIRSKATAGLHHATTGNYPLTYEQGSACTRMYGFLNMCAAAALVRDGAAEDRVHAALHDTSPDAFEFDEHGWRWMKHRWSLGETTALRENLFTSFGSCSFDEPRAELEGRRLL